MHLNFEAITCLFANEEEINYIKLRKFVCVSIKLKRERRMYSMSAVQCISVFKYHLQYSSFKNCYLSG